MISINVSGTKELMADLRKAKVEIQDEAREVLKEMAYKIRELAKTRVPVQKPRGKSGITPKGAGSLRNSIRYSVSRKKLDARVTAGGKVRGVDVFYASFIEYGTRYISARPFMKPSGRYYEEETQRRLTQVMFEALKRGVE